MNKKNKIFYVFVLGILFVVFAFIPVNAKSNIVSNNIFILDCDSILGNADNPDSVAWLVQLIMNYIRLFGILLVVVLSSLDFVKAIIANDDKNIQKAGKNLGVRIGIIVVLFLLPEIVMFLLELVGLTDTCVLS